MSEDNDVRTEELTRYGIEKLASALRQAIEYDDGVRLAVGLSHIQIQVKTRANAYWTPVLTVPLDEITAVAVPVVDWSTLWLKP